MKKVLVIEDHRDMQELLVWQIEQMGFIPLSAKTAIAGIQIAVAEKPDLILMDIMMPHLDGLEATRMLGANPETKKIPILAVTALFRSADFEACMKAGCVGYVVKPITLDDFQRKICDLLHQPQPV